MRMLESILDKIFIFEKKPQMIGLTQLKEECYEKKTHEPSIKNKDVKLSDLMRRVG